MPQPDEFEHWLRAQYQEQDYLDDDGFTDRVICALPARQAARPSFGWIQILAVMLGCLIAAWKVPVLGLLYDVAALAGTPLFLSVGLVAFFSGLFLVFYSVRSRMI